MEIEGAAQVSSGPLNLVPPKMNTVSARNIPNGLAVLLAATLVSVLPGTSQAQEATTSTETGEVVSLPQFTVNETKTNAYQSRQALSASRIALPILDIPQTLSVVPKELIEDSQGLRMLDVAKYVTPVQESTLPFGGDRYTIRGFTVSAEFIDGTMISGQDGYSTSQMPYNIERIEIIKGPNAILVPGGSPGGVMNPITKSPLARNAGSVTLEFGQYSPRAVSVDYNRVLTKDKKLQARVIAAYWNVEYYIKDQYRRGWELSPSISYQLSPAHKLTVKFDFLQNRETNLGGLPLDPAVPGGGEAQIARGLPRDWQFGNDIDTRHRSTERGSAELLSTLGSHTTSRLFIMGDHVRRRDVGGTSAAVSNTGGGSRNPNTGLWEPGVNWNTSAWDNDTTGTIQLVGTPSPVTDPSTWIYTRNNGLVYLEYTEAHIKNDYATLFESDYFKSTTLTGFSANTSKVHYKSWTPVSRGPVPNNALASITYPPYNFNPIQPGARSAGLGTDLTARQNDLQVFVYETLGLLKDRLQISGGVSRFFGNLTRSDTTGTVIDPTLNPSSADYNLTTNATSLGVVIKPIKQVSLFYSRNTTGGSMPGSISINATSPSASVAVGGQKEYGVKTELLGGKITGSVAYFDIAQSNYAVTNSEYYALVAAGRIQEAAALPPLYLNLKSKGWEFEGTAAVNKNLTIIGNYTAVKIRQPITDVRLRGVPDHSYGLYADYRFLEGALKGFGINVGADYKGDVAGENASGYTTSKRMINGKLVPVQPSFIIAARTLVNAGISYRADTWSATLSVNNVFDKDYILAAGSRTSMVVGTPRNVKGSITYKF